jgi:hypothetical protein
VNQELTTPDEMPGAGDDKKTKARLLVFVLGNAAVALFYDGFWLLGNRIDALDKLSVAMGYFQFLLWIGSFFIASYFPLKTVIKARLFINCLGLALFFSILLWYLIVLSTIFLGPYFDPWY